MNTPSTTTSMMTPRTRVLAPPQPQVTRVTTADREQAVTALNLSNGAGAGIGQKRTLMDDRNVVVDLPASKIPRLVPSDKPVELDITPTTSTAGLFSTALNYLNAAFFNLYQDMQITPKNRSLGDIATSVLGLAAGGAALKITSENNAGLVVAAMAAFTSMGVAQKAILKIREQSLQESLTGLKNFIMRVNTSTQSDEGDLKDRWENFLAEHQDPSRTLTEAECDSIEKQICDMNGDEDGIDIDKVPAVQVQLVAATKDYMLAYEKVMDYLKETHCLMDSQAIYDRIKADEKKTSKASVTELQENEHLMFSDILAGVSIACNEAKTEAEKKEMAVASNQFADLITEYKKKIIQLKKVNAEAIIFNNSNRSASQQMDMLQAQIKEAEAEKAKLVQEKNDLTLSTASPISKMGRMNELSASIKAMDTLVAGFNENIAQLQVKIEKEAAEAEKAEKEDNISASEQAAILQDQIKEAEKEKGKLKKDYTTLSMSNKVSFSHKMEQMPKIDATIASLETTIARFNKDIEQLQPQIATEKAAKEETALEDKLMAVGSIKKLSIDIHAVRQQIEESEIGVTIASELFAEAKKNKTEAIQRLSATKDNTTAHKQAVQAMMHTCSQAEQSYAEALKQCADTKTQLEPRLINLTDQLKKERAQALARFNAESEVTNQSGQVEAIQAQLAVRNAELAELQSKLDLAARSQAFEARAAGASGIVQVESQDILDAKGVVTHLKTQVSRLNAELAGIEAQPVRRGGLTATAKSKQKNDKQAELFRAMTDLTAAQSELETLRSPADESMDTSSENAGENITDHATLRPDLVEPAVRSRADLRAEMKRVNDKIVHESARKISKNVKQRPAKVRAQKEKIAALQAQAEELMNQVMTNRAAS